MDDKKNEFNVVEEKINQVFNERFYNISDFQRSYAWEKEQQDDLVKDIVINLKSEKQDNKYIFQTQNYFLGNIILKKSSFNKLDIVDGQQRLITLIMILVVIRNNLHEIVSNKKNKKEARDLSNKLILLIEDKIYGRQGGQLIPTITPSTKEEKAFFCEYILPRPDSIVDNKEYVGNDIDKYKKGFWVVKDKIESFMEGKYSRSALNKYYFFKAIVDQILESTVITMTLSEEEMAYKIYSNINSKGMHLSSVDLIKNDFLYKTRLVNQTPGVNTSLDLWNTIYENVKMNTSISFNEFYKYAWFTIYPEDIFEYFNTEISLFEIFQEKFPSEKNAKKIIAFFRELEKLSKYVKDFNYPNNVSEWKRDKWPIYTDKLEFLSQMTKDIYSNKYLLWLLPMHYKFKNTSKELYLRELQKRITIVTDTLIIYQKIKEANAEETRTIVNIQNFFDIIFKEIATFDEPEIIDRIAIEDLQLQFSSNIENKELLITTLSLLSYSKYGGSNRDKHFIRQILIRLNEVKGNHLLYHKMSIEHIIEDSERSMHSANIGNLVLLEQQLNDEAGKIKSTYHPEELLKEKFEKIYKKSDVPEVKDLVDDVQPIDFNADYIKQRAKNMVERYIQKSFENFLSC
ncbi:DUF262 domain-containing protein [Enterococcus hirae]